MKKKQLIIPLVMLVLLFGQITTSAIRTDTAYFEQSMKAVSSNPVFDSSDPDPVFERDEENHQGALIIADPSKNVTNVTVWYKLEGGDNTTIPYLFGDDGGFNLSWTEPTAMVYDAEKSDNDEGIAYYNYTFDIQSDFISFRAWYGEYEDEIGIPNIITTGVRIETYEIHSFYSEFDPIELNISLYNYNISNYGFYYREYRPHSNKAFENVTVTLEDNGVYRNVSASITHSFDPGTQVEIRAFVKQYDNLTKTERIYTENVAHIITISEGEPEISLETDRYTNELNVSVWWNATPVSGVVTSVEFNWGDGTVEVLNNVSIHTVYHLYDEAKEYNITVKVEAGASFGTETVTVLIDQVIPSASIDVIDDDENPSDKNITINGPKNVVITYNASDEGGSGIEKVRLETDEGNAYELTSVEGTYTIEFLEYGYHTVYLKVYDKAGNVYTTSVTFFIHGVTQPKDIGVPFSTVAIIAGIVSLTLILKRRR